jgi:hypothetical protein
MTMFVYINWLFGRGSQRLFSKIHLGELKVGEDRAGKGPGLGKMKV